MDAVLTARTSYEARTATGTTVQQPKAPWQAGADPTRR